MFVFIAGGEVGYDIVALLKEPEVLKEKAEMPYSVFEEVLLS